MAVDAPSPWRYTVSVSIESFIKWGRATGPERKRCFDPLNLSDYAVVGKRFDLVPSSSFKNGAVFVCWGNACEKKRALDAACRCTIGHWLVGRVCAPL